MYSILYPSFIVLASAARRPSDSDALKYSLKSRENEPTLKQTLANNSQYSAVIEHTKISDDDARLIVSKAYNAFKDLSSLDELNFIYNIISSPVPPILPDFSKHSVFVENRALPSLISHINFKTLEEPNGLMNYQTSNALKNLIGFITLETLEPRENLAAFVNYTSSEFFDAFLTSTSSGTSEGSEAHSFLKYKIAYLAYEARTALTVLKAIRHSEAKKSQETANNFEYIKSPGALQNLAKYVNSLTIAEDYSESSIAGFAFAKKI
ncbi:hypothetical protein NGRA_0001 [Nosema granulosis]|uniref:Uncharacterized protein n=1 Tax=Nosema granulosis TaxID=83296 RepID=A0A9P6H177_9MICR|nr:hypothetical protein NGRA_0001 [Nosema granulosis]